MIAAVVLAAGRSRRMGMQKLLLPIEGQPMIACVVDEVLRSPVGRVVVVVNPAGAPIRAALVGRSVEFVENPDPTGEMLTSIRCGLRALPDDCEAVLVVLGDQPRLQAKVVNVLIQAFRNGMHGIVVPTHAGRRGHPLLVSLRYRDEILRGYDQTGLRGLLSTYAEDVLEVEVDVTGILEDVDTPEDYRRQYKC